MNHRVKGGRRALLLALLLGLAAVAAVLLWGRGRDAEGLRASGTIEATEARLGFPSPGRIEVVEVREGETVARGQQLARLDRQEAQARRDQALAQLESARAVLAELESGSRPEEIAQARAARAAAVEKARDAERDLVRTRSLEEAGATSRESRDKAELAVEVANAQLRTAEEQLRLVEAGPRKERIDAQRAGVEQAEAAVEAYEAALQNLTIVAPFDGIVTVRGAEAGEIVPAGAAVLTLMNPGDRWVRIYVPETRIGAVRLGHPARITTDTFPDRRYTGEVSFIASEAEFTPKSVQTSEERVRLVYAVKVRIVGDAANELKPGMPADVVLPAVDGEGGR